MKTQTQCLYRNAERRETEIKKFHTGDVIIVGVIKYFAEQQANPSMFLMRANLPRGGTVRRICLCKAERGQDHMKMKPVGGKKNEKLNRTGQLR